MPDLAKRRSSMFDTPPPFLPPRKPYSKHLRRSAGPYSTVTSSPRTASPTSSASASRPDSLPSIPDDEPPDNRSTQLPSSEGQDRDGPRDELPTNIRPVPHNPRLQALRSGEQPSTHSRPPAMSRTPLQRHSSLRILRRPSDEDDALLTVHPALLASPHSAPCLRSELPRPHSHPPARSLTRIGGEVVQDTTDAWQAEPLSPPSPIARPLLSRPRASFQRLSSLDNLISYREEKAQWKRDSSLLHVEPTDPEKQAEDDISPLPAPLPSDRHSEASDDTLASTHPKPTPPSSVVAKKHHSNFRSFAAEIGFCFTIAATQFLGEYLISGFAIALPELAYRSNTVIELGQGTLGTFWPASLLSLILSATLLVFARLADVYGGYGLYMAGLIWLGVWTLIPGFCTSVLILDVSRAMQGLAVAAFMPSTFVMVSTFYETGPRKNFVLGLYSGCAPLGFFAGFLTAGALAPAQISWYFWVASAVAFAAAITAYLTVPHDWTDRKQLGLKMDWLGAFLITAGLILVSYALAYEPSADLIHPERNGFSYPAVYGAFTSGMLCLIAAVWVEGWYAKCPLLPFDFFRPKSTSALCFAALCFYASYGVWLYESLEYLQDPNVTKYRFGVQGIELAIWYTPTAVGGLILCVVGASLLHIVRLEVLILLSGLAWIGAPLLLAVCPLPLNYWAVVVPSMLCATLGIDLTYTLTLVHFSATQPKKYQGLCGAMCSILVNLAISFSLPLSEIIQTKAIRSRSCDMSTYSAEARICADKVVNWGFRSMFVYAAASAGLGFVVCVLFVRFPRAAAREKAADEERPRETSSESPTLVDAVEGADGEGAGDVESVRQRD